MSRFCAANGNPWGTLLRATRVRVQRRPFSDVAWYRLAGDDVSHDVVVKTARRRLGRHASSAEVRDVQGATRLEGIFGHDGTLGIVRPIGHYPDLGVVITRAVAAPNLGDAVEQRGAWWPSAHARADLARGCSLAGQWLERLHEARPALVHWTPGQLHDDVTLRIRLLRGFPGTYGLTARLEGQLRPWLEMRMADARPEDLVCSVTHGDYSPSNMLYDGRRLSVLDFTMVREAPRLLDMTRFAHQIGMLALKPHYRRSTLRALTSAFLDGYADPTLAASPLVVVFLLRHSLAHWLGTARRLKRHPRMLGAWWTCAAHKRGLARLVAGRRTHTRWELP